MASTPAACRDACSRRHDGMKIAHVVADLLTALSTATSVPAGLEVALQRLLRLSGAEAGALEFDPPRGEPVVVVAAGQIGRASCRERGEISVVDGAWEKKRAGK